MFNVGDKVVCINGYFDYFFIPENKIFTVELYTHINSNDIDNFDFYGGDMVSFEEEEFEFRADRFVKLTEYRKQKIEKIEKCTKKEKKYLV